MGRQVASVRCDDLQAVNQIAQDAINARREVRES